MNYAFLNDFCTIYRIPKIQEKRNTLYLNFDQKIPYTWIKMARDTVHPKPLAGPDWWDPTNLNKKACTDGQKKVKTDSKIDRRM